MNTYALHFDKLAESTNAFSASSYSLSKCKAYVFIVKKLLIFSMMLVVVAGCEQKKEVKTESSLPVNNTQSQAAQPPASTSAPSPKPAESQGYTGSDLEECISGLVAGGMSRDQAEQICKSSEGKSTMEHGRQLLGQ